MSAQKATEEASVISTTRRYIELEDKQGRIVSAIAESKAMDIVTGDSVLFDPKSSPPTVKKVLERKNCLIRCYRKAEKKLAANLDLVFLIAAVKPLFNTSFIDRLIVACNAEQIDTVMIVNKVDLGTDSSQELIKIYKSISLPVMEVSAKHGNGMDLLRTRLDQPGLNRVAMVGISGVGKSTLINKLVPDAERTTEKVSERTGQGRQTTTQSYALSYQQSSGHRLHLVDLPGLSSFGLTHLEKSSIQNYFREFASYREECQYTNCFHLKEPNCAVKEGVKMGEIAASRYQSYIEIVEEIDKAREY